MTTNSETKTIVDHVNHNKTNNINDEEETCHAYVSQLISAFTIPTVMNVTTKLGVLQIIYDHGGVKGLSPVEIATRIKTPNPTAPAMLDCMLRLLASYSVVTCTVVPTDDGGVERRYSPSPVTKFLVPDEDGVSLAAVLNLANDKVYLESWSKLGEAVFNGGIPFNLAHGMHAFEHPKVDQRFNEVFNKAMYQTTTFVIRKLLEKYDGLENIQRLVDVGGGLGHSIRVITSKYPTIKGINFDLPHVIENALPYSGVEHVSGDMFETIPNGDAIFLKWILHNWSDERCLKLLENCYKALPNYGKVIVVEAIIEDEALTTHFGQVTAQMNVIMMTQIPGGKERSRLEFEALAKAAGFSTVNFGCCVYNFWVMEFCK